LSSTISCQRRPSPRARSAIVHSDSRGCTVQTAWSGAGSSAALVGVASASATTIDAGGDAGAAAARVAIGNRSITAATNLVANLCRPARPGSPRATVPRATATTSAPMLTTVSAHVIHSTTARVLSTVDDGTWP
jgi:hypothetical protein